MKFFQHDAGEAEAQAVYDAIIAGDLTTGKQLDKFSDALKEKFGFPELAFANSGTSAIFLALEALDIGPGDEVITTPFVGVWTSNPILMAGATPVYSDIDPVTYNLCPKAIVERITPNTKAVIPVAVNGVPIDLKGLRDVLPGNVRIICDDIEALGSTRNGKYVGADIGQDISIGGFWVSKQVTTCSGGMAVSGDSQFIERFLNLSRHGHGRVGNMWSGDFGYNLSMPDPLAAMGLVQLSRMEQKQDRLHKAKSFLDAHFIEWVTQSCKPGDTKTEFVYMIQLPQGINKQTYAMMMGAEGIPTRPYFVNLMEAPHLKPYKSYCPVAETLSKRTIALPFHHKITKEDAAQIAKSHHKVLDKLGSWDG